MSFDIFYQFVDIVNLKIFFQLASVFLILAAGPLVIVLLASRSGNL